MTYIEAILQFAVVAFLLTIVPGLDVMLMMRSAIAYPKKLALTVALGINSGLLVWALIAVTGMQTIITMYPDALTILKIAGAIYLIFLGCTFIYRGLKKNSYQNPLEDNNENTSLPNYSAKDYSKAFLQGFMCDMLNPKIGVSYLLLIPNFLAKDVNKIFMGLSLGAVHAIIAMLLFTAMVLFINVFKAHFMSEKHMKLTDVFSGLLIALVGVAVLFE